MGKRLRAYLARTESLLREEQSPAERRALLDSLLIHIRFFQHERLIHLIVTATVALLTLVTGLGLLVRPVPLLGVIVLLLIMLLAFYIVHYYRLENGVQQLYVLYDRLEEGIRHVTE